MSDINGANNFSELAELVRKAKGHRSYKAYARDSGVSSTGIYRIIRGDYKPGVDTIRKLTADSAKPEGGVTFENMMAAAGYQSRRHDYPDILLDDGLIVEVMTAQGSDPEMTRQQFLQRYEAIVIGTLYNALVQSGHPFEPIVKGSEGYNQAYMRSDFSIRTQRGETKEWFFDIKYVTGGFQNFFTKMMAYLIAFAPDAHRKVSVVLNDPVIYERLKGYAGKLSYRGDLSIILFDEENLRFTEEKYIAHYDEKQSEFYLI